MSNTIFLAILVSSASLTEAGEFLLKSARFVNAPCFSTPSQLIVLEPMGIQKPGIVILMSTVQSTTNVRLNGGKRY